MRMSLHVYITMHKTIKRTNCLLRVGIKYNLFNSANTGKRVCVMRGRSGILRYTIIMRIT